MQNELTEYLLFPYKLIYTLGNDSIFFFKCITQSMGLMLNNSKVIKTLTNSISAVLFGIFIQEPNMHKV